MRTVAPPPPAPWLFLPRHDEVQLIHLRRPPRPDSSPPGLARFPAAWSEVPHSRIQSELQTFVSYRRPGVRHASYHCAALPTPDPATHPIARLTLADHRLSVRPTAVGYEAHWNTGDTWHHISGGPADLGAFMELILSLTLTPATLTN